MEKGGKHGLSAEVLNDPVPHVGGIAFCVARPALAVAGLAVLRLAHAGQEAEPHEVNRIERRPRGHLELLHRGQRRRIGRILHAQEIGQREEEAIIRRTLGESGVGGPASGRTGPTGPTPTKLSE